MVCFGFSLDFTFFFDASCKPSNATHDCTVSGIHNHSYTSPWIQTLSIMHSVIWDMFAAAKVKAD